MQLVDLSFLKRSKPDSSNTWKVNAIKKEVFIFDSTNKYLYWLIPKFTPIIKKTRLTPEHLAKKIVGNDMTA